MLRLLTLGYLDLRGSDGSDLLRDVGLSKSIALLAYLALDGHGGFHRRDTLVALLWPELDQSHARAALRKALHALRALDPALVVTRGDEEVRVAAETLWCDAVQLVQLAPEAPAEALSHYYGEFLPGFHVADAPDFERWVDETRHRLRMLAAECAIRVAEEARARKQPEEAVRLARRAAEIIPLEERPNRLLIEVLTEAGDRPAALAAYERFAQRLRADLEVQPSGETRLYADALRIDQASRSAAPPTPTAVPRSRRRAVLMVIAIVGGMLAAGAFWWPQPDPGTVPTRIAVFPLNVQEPGLAYLSEGVMDLLGHAIDGAGEISIVNPQLVTMRLNTGDSLPPDLARASGLAREFGAGRFVLGRVVPSGQNLQILVSLYDGSDPDQPEHQFMREGKLDSTSTLIMELARDLLLNIPTGPGDWVNEAEAPVTSSFVALREYARGLAALRRFQYQQAAAAFRAAVSVDSTFALAWMWIGVASSFLGGAHDTAMVAATDRALKFADRLSVRDRLLAESTQGSFHGDADRAEERALRLVSAYPNYAGGWIALGVARFWWAWQKGWDPANAKDEFDRARMLDPQNKQALHLSAWIAGLEGNRALADSLSLLAWGNPWYRVPADSARLPAFYEWLTSLDPRGLSILSEHMPTYVDRLLLVERIALTLTDSTRRPREEHSLGFLLQSYIIAAGGEWRRAELAFDRANASSAGVGAIERGWLAALPFLQVPADRRRAIRDSLRRWIPPEGYIARSRSVSATELSTTHLQSWLIPHAREYVLGLLSAGLGDETAATHSAAALEKASQPRDSIGLLRDFAFEIRALAAMTRGDTSGGLTLLNNVGSRLASHYQSFETIWHKRPLARLLRAEALAAVGREETALGWFAGLEWIHAPAMVLQTYAHFRRGQLLERKGDTSAAMHQYRRFVTRWEFADSALQPAVQAAQRRLVALGATRRNSN